MLGRTHIIDIMSMSALSSSSSSRVKECTEYPEWAICPITLELMKDPIMDIHGNNFERAAIVEWLDRGNTSCPLTRRPISYFNLAPNTALRMKIEQWKRSKNIPVEPLTKKTKQIHAIISESPNYACYSAKSQLVLAQYLASQQEEAQTKLDDSNNSGTAVLSSQRQQETPEERRSSVLRILEGVLSLA